MIDKIEVHSDPAPLCPLGSTFYSIYFKSLHLDYTVQVLSTLLLLLPITIAHVHAPTA